MKNITVDFAQLDSKEKLEAFLESEVSSGDSVHLKNYHRELMPWAEEAVATIAEVEDQSVLILVNACDSRKSVKTAAKERGVFLEDEAAKTAQEAPEGGSEGVS